MAAIDVILFQISEDGIHCRIVRVWASEEHINRRCKKKFEVARFKIFDVEMTKL
jgi:hypothetical protein